MIRKIMLGILSIVAIGFLALTVSRMQLQYNEEGKYFDGEVTYDSDAIAGYGTITLALYYYS